MEPTKEDKLEILQRLHRRALRLSERHTRRAEKLFRQQLEAGRRGVWHSFRTKHHMEQAVFHQKTAQNAEKYMEELGLQG